MNLKWKMEAETAIWSTAITSSDPALYRVPGAALSQSPNFLLRPSGKSPSNVIAIFVQTWKAVGAQRCQVSFPERHSKEMMGPLRVWDCLTSSLLRAGPYVRLKSGSFIHLILTTQGN